MPKAHEHSAGMTTAHGEAMQKPDEKAMFAVFGEAARILERAGVPYVVGGGLAVRAYGRVRTLKDGDLFLDTRDVWRAMDVLTREGGFHTRDMDANWLYKAIRDEVLIDLVVRSAGDIRFTYETFRHGRCMALGGHTFRFMGPEDLLFRKIHSHTEGRPDLFDAFSILEPPAPEAFDWRYFLELCFSNNFQKCLGFLLLADAEMGQQSTIPGWVLGELTAPLCGRWAGATEVHQSTALALVQAATREPAQAPPAPANGQGGNGHHGHPVHNGNGHHGQGKPAITFFPAAGGRIHGKQTDLPMVIS